MFKIIYRTLTFLAAAALVSLGLIWFSGTSAGQSLIGSAGRGGHDRAPFTQSSATGSNLFAQSNPPASNFGGDFGGHDGGANLSRGLADLPGKIGLVAAITAVIVLARKLLSLVSRKHGPGAAVPA